MISPRMLAAGLLPRDAPLYRDRGDALYVTRAPGGDWRGKLPGFRVELRGDWAYLYPLCALPEICGFRPDDLAERLKRFSGESIPAQLLLAGCMKAAERPVPAEIARVCGTRRRRPCVPVGGERGCTPAPWPWPRQSGG